LRVEGLEHEYQDTPSICLCSAIFGGTPGAPSRLVFL
jgi:hypothetical protein